MYLQRTEQLTLCPWNMGKLQQCPILGAISGELTGACCVLLLVLNFAETNLTHQPQINILIVRQRFGT